MNNFLLNIKINSKNKNIPSINDFYKWISYFKKKTFLTININIVNTKKIKYLNKLYKKKNKETNVLTFDLNFKKNKNITGNIIFCPSIIQKEATILQKPIITHWKYLTIHSILHLKGYSHNIIKNTLKMELIEEEIMLNIK
ncbi:MAG: rRNA maturation RNase YbeY [Candidatus Azosocius agrarius]|nr:MAG: rRNA maturation RNase YbeY [Gammaproteobacteria bacterium]